VVSSAFGLELQDQQRQEENFKSAMEIPDNMVIIEKSHHLKPEFS
jgi:hypothetical protein